MLIAGLLAALAPAPMAWLFNTGQPMPTGTSDARAWEIPPPRQRGDAAAALADIMARAPFGPWPEAAPTPSMAADAATTSDHAGTPQESDAVSQPQLSRWRFTGTLIRNAERTALLQDHENRLRHYRKGEALPGGLRLNQIEADRLFLDDPEGNTHILRLYHPMATLELPTPKTP